MAYPCDDEGCLTNALLLITNLELGEVLAYCGEHAGPYLMALGGVMTEASQGPPNGAGEAPQASPDGPAAPEATNGATRPKSGRKRPTAPQTTPEGAEAPAEAAPDTG